MVPARNAARTLEACLAGAIGNLASATPRSDVIVVDDGSTDATAEIARRAGARVLDGGGRGPGAARNLGWRATAAPLVWFVDSDCVPEPGALARLAALLAGSPRAAGAGGSYANLAPDSWLAVAIHEEIVWRHRRMGPRVDHLGSFHVLYRRSLLATAGGFDETVYNGPGRPGAEDMELSFRLLDSGWHLLFDRESRVGHFHPVRLVRYLRSQALHGRFATRLFLSHPRRLTGTSYSRFRDHAGPPFALALTAAVVVALVSPNWWPLPASLAAGLLALETLIALSVSVAGGDPRSLVLLPLGILRTFARAAGSVAGGLDVLLGSSRRPLPKPQP